MKCLLVYQITLSGLSNVYAYYVYVDGYLPACTTFVCVRMPNLSQSIYLAKFIADIRFTKLCRSVGCHLQVAATQRLPLLQLLLLLMLPLSRCFISNSQFAMQWRQLSLTGMSRQSCQHTQLQKLNEHIAAECWRTEQTRIKRPQTVHTSCLYV